MYSSKERNPSSLQMYLLSNTSILKSHWVHINNSLAVNLKICIGKLQKKLRDRAMLTHLVSICCFSRWNDLEISLKITSNVKFVKKTFSTNQSRNQYLRNAYGKVMKTLNIKFSAHHFIKKIFLNYVTNRFGK